MRSKPRIAILSGGGDCPGINAVIRAVAKKAILEHGMEVIGVCDGYEGIISNSYRSLSFEDVSGILTQGGTILGTSNTANPYRYPVKNGRKMEFGDVSRSAIANIAALKIDCLICIGGDGTLTIADRLFRDGVPIVGVPKTIDNDLRGTDITFGFDSAVAIATESIDRLHTTAQSHHRAMIVEVMGRNAGWIALYAGIASGGDVILLPEIPYDIDKVVRKVKERSKKGKRFTIIVVAEGAKPKGGSVVVKRIIKESTDPVRLGGIGFTLGAEIERLSGIESRAVILGHLQRSGIPTPFDRVLATRLGCRAVEMLVDKEFGYMVGVKGNSLRKVSLKEVARGQRNVPLDEPLIKAARSVGTCFGD
ncbi:MAG: ATP-dependent 6-phosphofructokinase [Dehalococcoidia bacterium]|nr:ATP-dependent 6-phosphofructokinase [Dehalococcoidia bacterium]